MSERSDRAAKVIKMVTLARNPMMDRVAVALNCGATWDECQKAREWEAAFQIADTGIDLTLPNVADEWRKRAERSSDPTPERERGE